MSQSPQKSGHSEHTQRIFKVYCIPASQSPQKSGHSEPIYPRVDITGDKFIVAIPSEVGSFGTAGYHSKNRMSRTCRNPLRSRVIRNFSHISWMSKNKSQSPQKSGHSEPKTQHGYNLVFGRNPLRSRVIRNCKRWLKHPWFNFLSQSPQKSGHSEPHGIIKYSDILSVAIPSEVGSFGTELAWINMKYLKKCVAIPSEVGSFGTIIRLFDEQ